MTEIKPLFPHFGGKRRAAQQVWEALGPVKRYIEPFFGSGAVLLGNPHPLPLSELVNDKDHHVANLWRSLQVDPDEVWRMSTAPCSEVELKARSEWLEEWTPPDFRDPDACDPTMAGVWLWARATGIKGSSDLHRGNHGKGVKAATFTPSDYHAVVERFRRVQVLCGDWSRCVTPSALQHKTTSPVGIFLDPPYGVGNGVQYEDGTNTVAQAVWEWACEHGDDPRLHIVVAGYEDGREIPQGWWVIERVENGGYSNQAKEENPNRKRECLWCSPHCIKSDEVMTEDDLLAELSETFNF